MSKAIIFADLHLHSHKDRIDRLEDCLNVLHWVFRCAEENRCKYIFFLGDLFHERSNIDTLNYLKCFEVFMRYMIEEQRDIDAYLLVGNHDMYHKKRWNVNSVKPLTAIPRCHIIDKPTTTILDGRRIDWLPHSDNPIDALKGYDKDGKSLMFAHLSIHGAKFNTLFGTRSDVIVEYDNDMVPVGPELFDSWEHTYLGHYHGAQHVTDKVEYLGSPLQLSFGEAFERKHIMLMDLETLETEYIENDFSPKHYLITPEDFRNDNYDLNGQFVRLIIDDLSSDELVEMKREIKSKYDVLSLDFKTREKRKSDEEETVIEDAKAILYSEGEMLDRYVSDVGIPDGLDEKFLKTVGKQCLEKKT